LIYLDEFGFDAIYLCRESISFCDLITVVVLHSVGLDFDSCGSGMQALISGAISFEAELGLCRINRGDLFPP
jgi:hypothetical protein